ncbi:MAG: phage portal protein [Rikenellaceae bacterium]
MKSAYINNKSYLPDITLMAAPATTAISEVWKWGANNLLPNALSALSRSSPIHRRILIDKADYISGRGFKCEDRRVTALCTSCNNNFQSLRAIMQRVALDKCFFGNATLEIVLEEGKIALYHQDVTRARLSKDKKYIVLNSDWSNYKSTESRTLPLYPLFEKQSDGTIRSIVHYKDYEPMFENYGVPKYIAALGAIAIAHKTERWNITRIDNAFSLSGVMVLDGSTSTEQEAEQIAQEAQRRFEGTPGQVMFMVKNSSESDTSKFVPITTSNDGDWESLHDQSTEDIIVAHSWFRTLSGMEYTSGFSSERVENEYNIALSTVIKSEQQDIIEPIQRTISKYTELDASTLEIVNLPPFDPRQPYMRVWEARKADGLTFDSNSTEEHQFLSQI